MSGGPSEEFSLDPGTDNQVMADSRQSGLEGFIARRIFLFAILLFFLELIFFRVLGYVTHYLESMLIIAYALAGVAVGGLAAARIQAEEESCYRVCLMGTYGCLFLSLWKVLRYPSLGVDNLTLVGMFAFPAYYIARAFRRHASGSVYLYDLAGAGLAVPLLLISHSLGYMEQILLATSLVIALLGLANALRDKPVRLGWGLCFTSLALLSAVAMGYEARTGRLNFFYLVKPGPLSEGKEFGKDRKLFRFYDNLIGRVEVQSDEVPGPRYAYVSSGMHQDGFRPDYPPRFRRDARLIGGFFSEPRMFIIGSSAEGVLKTARYMTRPELIDGSEINPAVITMMTEDFVKESGYAFMGLRQRLGNALAVLSRSKNRYDVITLMNPHSSGQMFLQGPPDWLHTQESYELYLSRLSEQGYMMVEERPMRPPGFEILLKRLATIYRALERDGARNPADHIFVYSWHWNRYKPYQDFTPKVFTSIFVKKNALTQVDKEMLMDWLPITGPRWSPEGKTWAEATTAERREAAIRFDYLPGVVERAPFREFFAHLAKGTVDSAYPEWDLDPVTDDRPFSAAVDRRHPAVRDVLRSVSWLAALLGLPVLLSFTRAPRAWFHARMLFYQLLAGAAYILVEVFLMQLYQKVVLSPNVAFVGVLSVLLISSGLGGRMLYRKEQVAWIFVWFALSVAAHLGLSKLFALGLIGSDLLTGLLIAAATAGSGFFMGAFLPLGLRIAREQGHEALIAEYFAINSLGGMLALALSLYFPIVYGFLATAALATVLYLGVAVLAAGLGAAS